VCLVDTCARKNVVVLEGPFDCSVVSLAGEAVLISYSSDDTSRHNHRTLTLKAQSLVKALKSISEISFQTNSWVECWVSWRSMLLSTKRGSSPARASCLTGSSSKNQVRQMRSTQKALTQLNICYIRSLGLQGQQTQASSRALDPDFRPRHDTDVLEPIKLTRQATEKACGSGPGQLWSLRDS